MKTIKLFYESSYLKEFNAKIIDCIEKDGHFETILDRTAFFPEGGGQESDTGFIKDIEIYHVEERNNVIYHFSKKSISISENVNCSIDFEKRFIRMQNHTGEHVLSGLANKMFGCTNVGFHLSETVTVDFDKELSKEQLDLLEKKSNYSIWKCLPVSAFFPSEAEQKALMYRSKKEIFENLRLVKIEEIDLCACCAPHVKNTGEIGIIKILACYRHRGGTRLIMVCGKSALDDYKLKNKILKKASDRLCVQPNYFGEAFEKYSNDYTELGTVLTTVKKELRSYKIKDLGNTDEEIIFFTERNEEKELPRLSKDLNSKTDKICYLFSGDDIEGYSYIISVGNPESDISNTVAKFNNTLNGVGGGKANFYRGMVKSSQSKITEFIKKEL